MYVSRIQCISGWWAQGTHYDIVYPEYFFSSILHGIQWILVLKGGIRAKVKDSSNKKLFGTHNEKEGFSTFYPASTDKL